MESFKIYWEAYGGGRAFFRSAYLWIALVLTIILAGLWSPVDQQGQHTWAGLALAVLPGLIAFSLVAIAIMLSMTSGLFLKVLHEDGANGSLFMQTVATFFHFILVQVVALVLVLALEAYDMWLLSFFAFWAFAYSLMCGVAAAANIVLLADLKNRASVFDEPRS